MVVLPLVPLTRATCRPWASVDNRCGSRANPARPPMTVPLPRPNKRDRPLMAEAVRMAVAARGVRAAAGDTEEDLRTVTAWVWSGV